MSKHTPGPWFYHAPSGQIEAGNHWVIATIDRYPTGGKNNQRANGQLIAAAPELLAAAHLAVACMEILNSVAVLDAETRISMEKGLQGLRVVIAKAEGK